jgi:hypothetical protein
MSTPHPIQWVPHWAASLVEASHTAWSPGDLQKIHARCTTCGDELHRVCEAGNARRWIEIFAVTHKRLHT